MDRKNIGVHFIAWGAYILYEVLISYFAGLDLRPTFTVLSFTINIAVFYATWLGFTYVKEHSRSLLMKTLGILAITVVTLTVSAASKMVVEVFIYHKDIATYLTHYQITALIMRWLYFYIIAVGFSYAQLAAKRNKEAYQYNLEKLSMLQEQERLKKNAIEAELNLIKSQINPHFVFNTLGFLHSKTYKAMPDVAKSILMLSNVMRHALTGSEDGYSSLESELSYINDFIRIHDERNELRSMEYKLEKNTGDKKVISLILITLVENIFKHGIIKDPAKTAVLNIEVIDNNLHFYSFNYKNNNKKVHSNKIGIEYVKQRLIELYPNDHLLTISETEETYECKLKLPLKTL
ncbi:MULTISPECIES: sensor histidine kinase [unclassified Pedobacter]|uniref:sensor histidine kinase n=1 Tax=unclassified Pedobacter TaxID=2628915 RepID=UPI00141D7AED|nr:MULTISPECIES: histidine kinase [unclassified Pedobacter]NII84249.1 sensor histidine kinase YesM [Pedobacter sp. SG908]NMN38836.1 sensor histidine kinase YesM [Pedobacter sp. SG918]